MRHWLATELCKKNLAASFGLLHSNALDSGNLHNMAKARRISTHRGLVCHLTVIALLLVVKFSMLQNVACAACKIAQNRTYIFMKGTGQATV